MCTTVICFTPLPGVKLHPPVCCCGIGHTDRGSTPATRVVPLQPNAPVKSGPATTVSAPSGSKPDRAAQEKTYWRTELDVSTTLFFLLCSYSSNNHLIPLDEWWSFQSHAGGSRSQLTDILTQKVWDALKSSRSSILFCVLFKQLTNKNRTIM